ncbi:AMP-binding protein [Ensifer soli]|uniref:AMP-binding protein n=1 Tax=Ciceribacter sp. sgz301302 TaxID=3342379 RepID=UPI0035BA7731
MATAPVYPIDGVPYRTDAEAADWFSRGCWIDRTAGDALRVAAATWGDRQAIVARGTAVTFRQFDERSERLAAALLELGLSPGDRAMFQMGNEIETAVALFACYKAGIVPVCSVPHYGRAEMAALARLTGARAHLVQADAGGSTDLVASAQDLRGEVASLSKTIVARGDPGGRAHGYEALIEDMPLARARSLLARLRISSRDVMKFQLSGGSTGLPKVIPRFHAEYLGHARDWALQFGKDETSVCLWSLPMVHNGGQVWALFPTVLIGCMLVLSGTGIDEIFDAIAAHRVTHGMSIGPIAPKILAHRNIPRARLGSLRIFGTMNRAAALEAALGIPCANVYGLTEGLVSIAPPQAPAERRHQTNGTPATPQNDLRLVVPGTEQAVAEGAVGELCFRGPSSLTGYVGDPAATARALTADGYVRTGDLFRLSVRDGERWLVFQGRDKDNIDRGGEKFGVEDIEVLIGLHPSVADGRVVAMPDPIMGERACAFLVLKPGARAPDIAELGAFLLSHGLATFKRPERIEVIDQQPVTGVGKLDRAALRARIAETLSREQHAGTQR